MKKTKLRLLVPVMALLLCGSALSQTMYKCGKTYQDRPCADGKGKSMGAATSDTPAATATTGPYAAECAQRGKDSLKIAWAREGGATEERMLGEATTAAQRKLVQDVYRKRGAASQIQVAIEADCVAEKEKLERDAALAAAAAVRAQREGTLPSAPPSMGAPSSVPSQTAPDPRQQAAADEAERKKKTCARLNSDMEDLRTQERRGGSAATMERLAESRRRLSAQITREGC